MSFASTARRRIARAWRAVAFVPTRRLALAVAVVAPLWLLSRMPGGAWIAFGAAMLLLLVALVDVAMLPAPRDLDVERRLEPTIGVGDDAELRYRIESRWARPLVRLAARRPARRAARRRHRERRAAPRAAWRGGDGRHRSRDDARRGTARRRRPARAHAARTRRTDAALRARRPGARRALACRRAALPLARRASATRRGRRALHPEAWRGPDLRQPARLRRRRRPAPHRLEGVGAAGSPDHARVHDRAVADGLSARRRRALDDAARRRVLAVRVRTVVGAGAGGRGEHRGRSRRRDGVRRGAPRARAGAAGQGGAAGAARGDGAAAADARRAGLRRRRSARSRRASASGPCSCCSPT